jgi:hypothetical protein
MNITDGALEGDEEKPEFPGEVPDTIRSGVD